MYTIIFEDNSIYHGGTLKNTLWSAMPDKKIRKIFYDLGKKKFEFSGYDSYNLIIEKAMILNRDLSSVRKIYLMARNDNNVTSIVIDLIKNNIIREVRKAGQEWRGQMTTGWQEGLKAKPKILMNP